MRNTPDRQRLRRFDSPPLRANVFDAAEAAARRSRGARVALWCVAVLVVAIAVWALVYGTVQFRSHALCGTVRMNPTDACEVSGGPRSGEYIIAYRPNGLRTVQDPMIPTGHRLRSAAQMLSDTRSDGAFTALGGLLLVALGARWGFAAAAPLRDRRRGRRAPAASVR
ncbi:hypothetical protein [Tsukamurella soli]|uniref:DUF3592 domain-containing protein n=1 Tax=Tsukamurella soli TaxID=644556 RepID=A0ABP8K2U0_9ACTN